MYELYKAVFGNIVLFRTIFKFVRLYKKNEYKKISYLIQLQEYEEREYIGKLEYDGDDNLVCGDLPTGGVLKEVKLNFWFYRFIYDNIIPQGVEILEFYFSNNQLTETPISTFPSTIHTLKGVVLPIGYHLENKYSIPSNVTSISFRQCPKLSNNNNYNNNNNNNNVGYIVIPNTIKELEFRYDWNNEGMILVKGDIPIGVTSLSIRGYPIKNLTKGVLPNSIKQLKITCNNDDLKIGGDTFNFIPTDIEIMAISFSNCKLTPRLKLSQFQFIKKLEISFYGTINEIGIEGNSLPTSLTDLSIDNIIDLNDIIPNNVINLKLSFSATHENNFIKKGIIPNSVTSLTLNRISNQEGTLPSSLTHLELTSYYSKETIIKLISMLPSSLTSITIPRFHQYYNHPFPSSINIINYK